MKKLHLLKTMLLLFALIVGSTNAWGQVTIWSEDFSGYSADDVPSGSISLPHTGTSLNASGTLTYACTNGTYTDKGKQKTSSTKIYNENLATGTSPELMVARTTGGSFTATIPLDNIEGTLTLTYYQNKQSLKVSSPTEGVSGGQTLKPSDAGQQTTTFTGITADMTSITIVFETTTSSNVRLDNIVLTGYKAEVPITSIAFSEPKTASVAVGGTTTLIPTILPANYNKTVDWESDDTDVATVNSSGVVTGIAAGTAHITAKAHDNPSTIYDVCTVTVTAAIPVTSVSLKSSTTLLLGGTETLEATVSPNDATNKNVTWSSADDTKVSVDEDGVITGVALTGGSPVNITVTTEDGSFSAICAVTVNPVPVSSVGLDKTSAKLVIGKTLTLEATVLPDNATDKSVTWESDDTDVATVDEDGKVTAVAEGTATITVKSVADPTKKAECTITVTDGSIDLDVTGEIEITSFPSFSGSGYKSVNPYTIGDYDWIATNCMLNNSCLQLKKSEGVLTSPTIKCSKGITVTVTVPTNSVTVSDGTSSSSTSNGVAILTTTKTSTTITISSGDLYAQVSKIKIAPTPANPSAPVDNGDNTITLTTTANMAGWRAFYDATKDYKLDANTKAYVVTAESGTADEVELTKLNVTAIPHGEAVILKTTDAGHSMTLTETTGVATLGTNLLAVTDGASNVDGYRLGYGNIGGEDAVGFFKYTTTTAPAAGIVYIDKSNVNISSLSRGLSISFADDETTGINAVENINGEFNNAVYYNLSGQRVANPSKGLYIVNGKKVIIK